MKKKNLVLGFCCIFVTTLLTWQLMDVTRNNESVNMEKYHVFNNNNMITDQYSFVFDADSFFIPPEEFYAQFFEMENYQNFQLMRFYDKNYIQTEFIAPDNTPHSIFNNMAIPPYEFFENIFSREYIINNISWGFFLQGYDINNWEDISSHNNNTIFHLYNEYQISINEKYLGYLILSQIFDIRNRLIVELIDGPYSEVLQLAISLSRQGLFAITNLTYEYGFDWRGFASPFMWDTFLWYDLFYNNRFSFDYRSDFIRKYVNFVLDDRPILPFGTLRNLIFDFEDDKPNVFLLYLYPLEDLPFYMELIMLAYVEWSETIYNVLFTVKNDEIVVFDIFIR